MGGGGASGSIDFPKHINEIHKDWLGWSNVDSNVDRIFPNFHDVLGPALSSGNNPFRNFNFTDSEQFLSAPREEIDKLIQEAKFNSSNSVIDDTIKSRNLVDNNNLIPTIDTTQKFTEGSELAKKEIAEALNVSAQEVDKMGVLKNIDIESVVQNSQGDIKDVVSTVIEEASKSIDQNIIEDLVVNFERSLDKTRARGIRRFTSGMADANAVQSSAFAFGRAMLEADFQDQVAEFSAETINQTYLNSLQNAFAVYLQTLSSRLEIKIREKINRDNLINQVIQLYNSLLINRSQLGIQNEDTKRRLETDSFLRYTGLMQRNLFNKFQVKQAFSNLDVELQRMRYVGTQETEGNQIQIDEADKKWQLEVWNYAPNMLGAPSGAAGRVPGSPSRAGSALGGAASGVALASSIGSGAKAGTAAAAIGGPIGIGIAGAVGLTAGLLNS